MSKPCAELFAVFFEFDDAMKWVSSQALRKGGDHEGITTIQMIWSH